MQVGIVGCGFVGGAIRDTFKSHYDLIIYDKYKDLDKFEDLLKCDVIFIAVPTPFDEEAYQVDISAVDETFLNLNKIGYKETVVIKSTIPVGTTQRLVGLYPDIKIVFNPEFLKARSAAYDYKNQTNLVFGCQTEADVEPVLEILYNCLATSREDMDITFLDYKTAELIKYSQNVMFASRVTICNIIFDACQQYGIDYEVLKQVAFYNEPLIGRNVVEVPGPDGLRGFGGACLTAGSKVQTLSGFTNIEELLVGEELYDDSSVVKVTGLSNREVNKVIKINSRGRELEGSEDHIHFVYDHKEKQLISKKFSEISEDDWVYILKPKYRGQTKIYIGERPKRSGLTKWVSEIKITDKIARLFGLYAAEGHRGVYKYRSSDRSGLKNEYTVTWSFGGHERELAQEVCNILFEEFDIKAEPVYKISEQATFGISRTWIVRVRSMWLYYLFKAANLGNNSHTKNTLLLDGDLAKNFISGWLDGDGNFYKNPGTIAGYSVSKSLIKSIDIMLLKLGYCAYITHDGCKINISTKKDVLEIAKWMKSGRFSTWGIEMTRSSSSPKCRIFENGWITKIRNIQKIEKRTQVFAIETSSGKYIANGMLTHNCLPKDTAGFNSFSKSEVITAILEYNQKQNRKIE